MNFHVTGDMSERVASALKTALDDPDTLAAFWRGKQLNLSVPGHVFLVYRGKGDNPRAWLYHGYPVGPDLMANVSSRTRLEGGVALAGPLTVSFA